MAPERSPRVGLFVTCLVDLLRPSVGFAAAKLLSDAGCEVEVPTTQTWATEGCSATTSSTSRGYTLKPPVTIMSLTRSTMNQ